MGDSLIIDNSIQIMEGPQGTASSDPRCTGAIFQIAPGYDFGAPQPIASIVASLMTDGERPLGRRSSNRTMVIPVQIWAPTRSILVAAREVILMTVDQQSFNIVWAREGGPGNLVFKAFRQQAPVPTYDIKAERGCIQVITLTVPALPFGQSDTSNVLTFAGSAVAGAPAPLNPATIDNYSAITSANWSAQAAGSISGNCAHYTNPNNNSAAVFTTSGIALNIAGLVSLNQYIGIATAQNYWGFGEFGYYYGYGFDPGSINVGYVLTDNLGATLSFGTAFYLSESYNINAPNWDLVSLSIPQVSGFNYSDVVKVVVTITNYQGKSLNNTDVFLDEFYAAPGTTTAPVISERGAIYGLNGITGTAHTYVTFQVAQTGPGIEFAPAYPAAFSNGYLQLPCTSAFTTAVTGAVFDLAGSSCFLKVAQVPQVGNGGTVATFQMRYDASNYFSMTVSGGILTASLNQAGTVTSNAIGTYTSGNYGPYWRIRENGGTVYFDTAPDGSTWTNQWSSAHTLAAKIPYMRVRCRCGYTGTEVSPEPMLVGGINTI